MVDATEEARQRFAEESRFTAKLGSRAVVEAFAKVPRERFFGPGPWRVLSPMAMAENWTTEDADPPHLSHDVLVAINEERRLNCGCTRSPDRPCRNNGDIGGGHLVGLDDVEPDL